LEERCLFFHRELLDIAQRFQREPSLVRETDELNELIGAGPAGFVASAYKLIVHFREFLPCPPPVRVSSRLHHVRVSVFHYPAMFVVTVSAHANHLQVAAAGCTQGPCFVFELNRWGQLFSGLLYQFWHPSVCGERFYPESRRSWSNDAGVMVKRMTGSVDVKAKCLILPVSLLESVRPEWVAEFKQSLV